MNATLALPCCVSGGLYARESDIVDIAGNVSFMGNSASNDGGAMSIDSVGELQVDNAIFVLNEASSGGAVSVTATTVTGSDPFLLRRCVFEGNSATDGGALYFFNSARRIAVEESLFLQNNACKSYHDGTKLMLLGRYCTFRT